jgi:hypothetical protein
MSRNCHAAKTRGMHPCPKAPASKRVGFRCCSQKVGLFRNYPHDQIILNIDGSGVHDKWHKLQVSETIVRPWCESELFSDKAK